MATRGAVIRVEGVKELQKRLKGVVGSEGRRDLIAAMVKVAEPVVDEAQRRVPVRSGRLRGSIRAAKRADGVSVSAGRGKAVPYAAPIHWGWRKRGIRPDPFIYAAADAKRDEVLRRYADEVTKLGGKAIRRS